MCKVDEREVAERGLFELSSHGQPRGCGAYGRKETAFDDQHHRFIERLFVPPLSPASTSEYVNDFGLALYMHCSANVALFHGLPSECEQLREALLEKKGER